MPIDTDRIRALIPDLNQVVYAEPVIQPVANAPPHHMIYPEYTPQEQVLQRQATVPLLLDEEYPLQDMYGQRDWNKLELEGCIKRCIYN